MSTECGQIRMFTQFVGCDIHMYVRMYEFNCIPIFVMSAILSSWEHLHVFTRRYPNLFLCS